MKSKLMKISSFSLAVVASLVMAFAAMSFTKTETATVSADPNNYTLYFHVDVENDKWGEKNPGFNHYYVWYVGEGDGDEACADLPSATDGWYVLNLTSAVNRIILYKGGTLSTSNWWEGKEYQSSDIVISNTNEGDKTYFVSFGSETARNLDYSSYNVNPYNYYIVGSFNSWTASDAYSIGTSNNVKIFDLSFNKDEELKVRYPLTGTDYGSENTEWDGGSFYKSPFFSRTQDYDNNGYGNVKILRTGKYMLYFNSSNKVEIYPDFELQTTMHKTSVNKDYLLLVTGMNYQDAYDLYNSNSSKIAIRVGYTVTGLTAHEETTDIFTGVVTPLYNGGSQYYDATTIYDGITDSDKYKLIVDEIACNGGESVTVQAYVNVYFNSTLLYTSTNSIISGTISTGSGS